MRGRRGVLGMLGQRRVTPGWADDPVRRQGGSRLTRRRGRSGLPPPEGHHMAGGGGGGFQKVSYVTISDGA